MKKRPNAAQAAARKSRRAREFGPDAECYFCGWRNPVALIAVSRTLLEEHHIDGLNNCDDTRVVLCRNHHALLTEGCLDAGASMRAQRSVFERVAQMFRIRSVFERASAENAIQIAIEIDALVESLDERFPHWREDETEKK
jgi:hypothetical protein